MKIKLPDFELEDIEDYYTYYVMILKLSEEIFWYADLSFVLGVVEDKAAFDNWLEYEKEKEWKRNM